MKAYQIVDLENPKSVQYHEISKESYKPALEEGLIEDIIPVQAITPSNGLEEWEDKFNWDKSLAKIDSKHGDGTITPTERSGNISHWLLMQRQAESDERFLIMEHDSYLLDLDRFRRSMMFMNRHDMCYANLGLFMSCYSYSKHCAQWQWELLTDHNFPINCGPYGVAERMYKTYADNYLVKNNYLDKKYCFMTHMNNCKHIGFGKTSQEMFETYNYTPNVSDLEIPTTQVIKRDLLITQDHVNYAQHLKEHPWERSNAFVVID